MATKNKPRAQVTITIRVFKSDWETLKRLAERDRRTLQDEFGVIVNVAERIQG